MWSTAENLIDYDVPFPKQYSYLLSPIFGAKSLPETALAFY